MPRLLVYWLRNDEPVDKCFDLFVIYLWHMNTSFKLLRYIFSVVIGVVGVFAASLPQAHASVGASLTVAPAVNGTDNLIAATNASWVFTATTTANVATSSVVQIFFPSVNNAQPFDTSGVTFSTSTNVLFSSTGIGPGGVDQAWYGVVSSTVASGTKITVRITGITNASGQLNSMGNLSWRMKAGVPVSTPYGNLSETNFSQFNLESLVRAGGALVSDNNSGIAASAYGISAAASYLFSIKATSSIPIGGKIVINFPSGYSLQGVTVDLTQTISNNTATQLASFTTTTSVGVNRVTLVTSIALTNAGDTIAVAIDGLTNPSTVAVYRPFFLYTTKANGGLLDGSIFGFENADYGSGAPPPVDTIHIGGTNTVRVVVYKQNGSTNSLLTGTDLTQVKVGIGCPDKGFFVGEKWLDANSSVVYNNLLDCNYMVGSEPFNKGDNSFYNSFLPPSFKTVPAIGGQSVTSSLIFGIPDATVVFTITGGVTGQNALVRAYSPSFESFSPIFTDHTYTTPGFSSTGTGYVKMKVKSGQSWNFNVQSGAFGNVGNFSSSGTKYWPPSIPSTFIGSSGTSTLGVFSYIQANKALLVTLSKVGGGVVNNACVGVKRSGGGMFMGSQDVICQPNYSNNQYLFKVPLGSINIEVMRQGFGRPEEYPIGIIAATTTKEISISSPTSYISIKVQDASGNAINGAPVFANGSSGFGQSMTNSSGTSTIYVPAGSYTVEGFAPALGPLTAQTATVGVTNPLITFTVNSATFKTISGRVTSGGTGVSGVKVGAHGTGSTTGGNGTETDSDGNYLLYVPAGTYEVGGWSDDTGGLSPQNANVSSASVSNINWTLSAKGTLRIIIQNSSNVSPLFAGAFDATTGRGNGSDSWTATGTSKYVDLGLAAGTYNVRAGSPVTGEITPGGETVTVIAGNTVTKTYNISTSSTIVTLSGTVTTTGNVAVANANVWASRIGGPGFFSTQTDTNGAYSLNVPDGKTYLVGVKTLGYVASQGDVEKIVSGSVTQNFTLVSAGETITGTIRNTSAAAITNGWVSAKKTVNGNDVWTGAPTNDEGGYSLTVDSGTWTVYADGPCYVHSGGLSAATGSSGKDITLTATSNCTVATPQLNGITAASGGQVSKDDMTLDIPANALGTSQSTVSVSISDTDLVVSSPNATPLKRSVQSITATDSSGNAITSLQSSASLTMKYDPTELPNGFDESSIQLGYFDSTTGQWEPVAATIDTVNNKITVQITHFTDYGPILPGVPAAPATITATAASASQVDLSWSASVSADYYTIYRSLTDSSFTTSIATTTAITYSDTGRSASTAYYYKVAGVNTNGEGPNSSSANATTNAAATTNTVQPNPSGGSGSSSYAPGFQTYSSGTMLYGNTPTATSTPVVTQIATTSTVVNPSVVTTNVAAADPSNLPVLLALFGLERNTDTEKTVLTQVRSDAKQFGLVLTEDQATTMRNFITYGISKSTRAFGRGEQRAILRDYMETVHRSDVVWSDIERLAIGQIPIKRNLVIERANVSTALPVFKRLFGHNPDFKIAKENLAWNTLLYRIRFPRDMEREAKGLKEYRTIYKHNPTSPFSWAVVRAIGYVR